MFNKNRAKITSLHRAVIEGRTDLVKELKDSEWRYSIERNGFNPLELAQLLGQQQCQQILQKMPPICINVQLKDQEFPTSFELAKFENTFKVIYRSFLTFPSYYLLEDVIHDCPYLLRFEWLISSRDEWEASYQKQLLAGTMADTFIKWINPTIGYGLFAAVDLPEKSFIGEYTGIIRRVNKNHPSLNDYCFHYPTRFWSSKYFVIDAFHEGNMTRFINHSNHPNLQPLWLVNRNVLHLVFIANRFISKGTELTFDYGSDYWLHREK